MVHYASSLFEGIRCYDTPQGPAIFRLKEHTDRLVNSAKIYRMDLPYTREELAQAMIELVRVNNVKHCYLRPVAFRGEGEMGVNPLKNPIEVYILAWAWGKYLGDEALRNGVDVCVSSWQRIAPNTLPAMAKAAANYMNSQLIKMEAITNGYTEGISLDTSGHVSEGSGENIFVVRDGKIYTPPTSASVLPGITRDSVVTLALEMGYPLSEQNISREMLYIGRRWLLVWATQGRRRPRSGRCHADGGHHRRRRGTTPTTKFAKTYRHLLPAILAEPLPANMGLVPPADGFLQWRRERADATGALLVLDEVISGFRVARGGAQELLGVQGDLGDPRQDHRRRIDRGGARRPRRADADARPQRRRPPGGDAVGQPAGSGGRARDARSCSTKTHTCISRCDHRAPRRRPARGCRGHEPWSWRASWSRSPEHRGTGDRVSSAQAPVRRAPSRGRRADVRIILCQRRHAAASCSPARTDPPPSRIEAWFPSLARTAEQLERTVEAALGAFGRRPSPAAGG